MCVRFSVFNFIWSFELHALIGDFDLEEKWLRMVVVLVVLVVLAVMVSGLLWGPRGKVFIIMFRFLLLIITPLLSPLLLRKVLVMDRVSVHLLVIKRLLLLDAQLLLLQGLIRLTPMKVLIFVSFYLSVLVYLLARFGCLPCCSVSDCYWFNTC